MAHYLDNQLFTSQVLLAQDSGQVGADLAESFLLLARNVAGEFRCLPSEREDAVQEAVMQCCRKYVRYDPDKGKAFNYFTSIVINTMRQLRQVSMVQREIIERLVERLRQESRRSEDRDQLADQA